ncbi:MAG: S8 family serine peptidase [Anaerolineales bacterium]|nr:S8 family serine peptidase [Anaerolineales bacterium]
MKSKSQIANIFYVLVILAMLIAPVSAVSFAASSEQNAGFNTKLGSQLHETAAASSKIGKSATGLYIVRLTDPALASYTGGIEGLAATSPLVTGLRYIDIKAPASVAYLDYLKGKQVDAVGSMEKTIGRTLDVRFQYLHVLNGMAVAMSASEAAEVAKLPGVLSVSPDLMYQMDTDAGPTWIGAPEIWNGNTVDEVATKGEGILIGVIDSGINHDHPSFATVGEDGYVTMNPFGTGNAAPGSYCDVTDPSFCNDKLVGAWDLNSAINPNDPEDDDGHGSHTASTAGGNVVTATLIAPTTSITATISGVAPHANIIAYKVCEPGCPGSSSIAAVDQAIVDRANAGGVPMVLNYSISGSDDPWNDGVDQAFLDAFNAGIFVSASAGNDGPGASTVAKTGGWNASVGASTHNRALIEFLQDMTGGDTTPPADLQGAGFTAPYASNNIVYAGDYGDPLCGTPFPAGTWNGEIVICDRGIYARVDKGANVLAGGAGGYVLANDIGNGNSLVADPHFLPAVHIGYDDGVTLKTWVADGGSDHMGAISGTIVDYSPENGDIMASFSSRGPSQFNVIKPDYVAPGVDIWAAYCCGSEFTFLGGTSMASPHGAGSAALMMALHPDWSPAEIKSALAMTSVTNPVPLDGATANVLSHDLTPANWFDMGSGRLNLGGAANTGLVMDETYDNFVNADPDLGGDPSTLNLPNMQDNGCFGECSWVRTVSSSVNMTTTWEVSYEVPDGMMLDVTPMSFTLAPYASQTLTVTANVSGLPSEEWAFAQIYLNETTFVVDLSLEKSDGGITADPGDTVAYTLSYANNGTADASGVVLYETVPANATFNAGASDAGWEWVSGDNYMYMVGDLAMGDSGSVVFAVDVDDPVPSGVEFISNTAVVMDDAANSAEATDTTPLNITVEYALYLPLVLNNYTGAAFVAPSSPTMGELAGVHMPIAVYPVSCAAPSLLNFTTSTSSGSEDRLLCPASLEITEFTASLSGLTAGMVYTDSLSQDPTNGDPYDNLNDGTTRFITTTVSGAARLVAEIVASEAPDMDLFVGMGDTPSEATLVCSSTTGSYIEYCNINDPADGTWWVLVQSWAGSASQPDNVTFVVGVVPAMDEGNWDVTGPNIALGDPLTVTVSWNEPSFTIGDYWYGDLVVGTGPSTPDNLARVNVNFEVVGIPMIDTDATTFDSTQGSGEVVTYTMAITNVGTAPLDWAITEDNNDALNVPSDILWDNGPLVNSPGTGAGGADESMLQSTSLGMGTFGFGQSVASGTRVSDQFTITEAAGWTITGITTFGYQTGSTTTSTFTEVNYNIWDGNPMDPGSSIIYTSGGNALVNSIWSNIYRVSETTSGNNQRPIMANTASAGFYLPQGTYWLDFQSAGSLASGPWAPPITINGQTTTGDAVQSIGGVWAALVDVGPQGLPFIIEGTIGGAAQPCELNSAIDWVSAVPSSGTNAPGAATNVDVVFDSSGLGMGNYSGYLCLASNDPATPLITIPVSLDVTSSPPVIEVNPTSVSGTQNPDTVVTHTLDINNVGGGVLNWTIDELDAGPFRQSSVETTGSSSLVPYTPEGAFQFSSSASPVTIPSSTAPVERSPLQTVTHSASQTITSGNSVSCNAGGLHADNHYYRAFDLPSFGVTSAWDISSVDVGVEQATGAGGSQPVTLILYAAPSGTSFPGSFPGSFTQIASVPVVVTDQNLTVLNIPVVANVPANSVLVVELFTPDGQTAGNSFFVGSNSAGQTAPSYIAAADCGIPNPTDLAAIGFGGMHIVMNVTGDVSGGGGPSCASPVDIPWLSLDPNAGATNGGATSTVDVVFDSTGLSTGVYTGTLCVNSNDSVTPLVEVPVEMTVSSGGGGGTFDGTATPNLAITDNTYNGTIATMTCSAIDASTIPGGNLVTGVTLDLGITHTWVGDLVAKLISPDGSILGVFSRPGVTETADDGNDTAGFGDSSNLAAANVLFFSDAFADNAELMGNTITTSQVICLDDGRCTYFANPGAVVGVANFAGFTGENASGNWQLCVGDAGGGDIGTLATWAIHIDYAP